MLIICKYGKTHYFVQTQLLTARWRDARTEETGSRWISQKETGVSAGDVCWKDIMYQHLIFCFSGSRKRPHSKHKGARLWSREIKMTKAQGREKANWDEKKKEKTLNRKQRKSAFQSPRSEPCCGISSERREIKLFNKPVWLALLI